MEETARRLFRAPATIWLPDRPPLPVRALALGTCGMSIATAENLGRGRACAVAFALPDPRGALRSLRFDARVIDAVLSTGHGFKVGLQFLRPDPAPQALVERFVRQR